MFVVYCFMTYRKVFKLFPISPIECISKTLAAAIKITRRTTYIFLKENNKLLIKPNNIVSISELMLCANTITT